jgi:hypothetical protein
MYLWIKAFHVIAVIAWMAGMLYLPRLFVYHCDAEKGSVQSETFKVMERRLLKAIINPAMIVAWVLGLYLAWEGGWFRSGCARPGPLGGARPLRPLGPRLRRRPQHETRALLSRVERGAHGAPRRHRHPRHRQAVLMGS